MTAQGGSGSSKAEEEKPMRTANKWWLMGLLGCYLGLAGAQQCGKQADSAIKSADQAVAEARAVDAANLAPTQFRSAEQGLSEARGLFKKWSFKQSEESAVKAESQARLARKMALEQKAEADKRRELDADPFRLRDSGAPGQEDVAGFFKDIPFDYDSHGISSEAKAMLAANAATLKSRADLKVRIEGHCDERGSDEYNLALGVKRAKSVKDFLIHEGISAERLETISFGESLPLDPGHNESAYSQNRRVHFALIR
jgi:peptidoglycan-associated lipoprotein